MTGKQKWTASVAVVAGISAAATWMVLRHAGNSGAGIGVGATRAQVIAAQPQLSDEAVANAIQQAHIAISGLTVRTVGPIVVLRGTGDTASARQAEELVKNMGFHRVANLVNVAPKSDDERIRRDAERQLAGSRSLDGCTLRVSCDNGVLRVSGTVQHELQKDAARQILRSVQGAKEVRVELSGS